MKVSTHTLFSRVAAVGIFLAALWMSLFGVALPAIHWLVDAGPSQAEMQQLSSLKVLIADDDRLRKSEASLQALIGSSHVFWKGLSDNRIAALLQGKVQSLLVGRGQLVSVSNNTPGIDHGLRRVGIRFEAALPLELVQGVTAGLETSSPTIFIDRFSVTASQTELGKRPNVTLECDISALARTP